MEVVVVVCHKILDDLGVRVDLIIVAMSDLMKKQRDQSRSI